MRINNNLMAMNTHRQLGLNANAGSKSIEKLSSGFRINRAGDDAAGLSISEKMRSQIRGLGQASRNAQDGISLIQTAEGALNESQAILQRMRELAVQSATGTNTDDDRSAIQNEVQQLKTEIDRIGETTEFNTQKLLNGSLKSVGGATAGIDTTTGAQVAKLKSASLAGSASMSNMTSALTIADTDFVEETIKIDGTDVKVDWSKLTADEKNILKGDFTTDKGRNDATDLIEAKINEAIDADGGKVDHVSIYSDATTKAMTIESGSKGINSKVVTSAGQVIGKLAGAAAISATGTTNYAGTDPGATDQGNIQINGVSLKFSGTQTASILGTGATTMASAASLVQSDVNTMIGEYNSINGLSNGEEGYIQDVAVAVTDDGRLQVTSESGPVTFSDNVGTTGMTDLGLTDSQTSAAGNGGMTFQIGANEGQTLQFGVGDMRSQALGLSGSKVDTATAATNAITDFDNAVAAVSKQRSELGAVQNRLEHTIKNLDTSAENLQASESRIRDVDMAKEMMTFTKNNILQQAAQSMLAQANQAPQGVLQLLR